MLRRLVVIELTLFLGFSAKLTTSPECNRGEKCEFKEKPHRKTMG
jgi:hypothetical protein